MSLVFGLFQYYLHTIIVFFFSHITRVLSYTKVKEIITETVSICAQCKDDMTEDHTQSSHLKDPFYKHSKFFSPIIRLNAETTYEPHREKTGYLPMRKQRRRSASR